MSSKQLYYCLFPEGQLESYVVAIMSLVKRDRVAFYTYDLKDVPKLIHLLTPLPEFPVLVEQGNVITGGFVSFLHYLEKRVPEPILASTECATFSKEISVYTTIFRFLEPIVAMSADRDESKVKIEKSFSVFCESCEKIAIDGYLVPNGRFNIVDCLMLGFVCMAEDLGFEFISLVDFHPNLVKYINYLSSLPYKKKLLNSLNEFRISTPFWEKPDFDINLYIY